MLLDPASNKCIWNVFAYSSWKALYFDASLLLFAILHTTTTNIDWWLNDHDLPGESWGVPLNLVSAKFLCWWVFEESSKVGFELWRLPASNRFNFEPQWELRSSLLGCGTTNSEPPPNCRIPIEVMAKGHRSPPDGLDESSEKSNRTLIRQPKHISVNNWPKYVQDKVRETDPNSHNQPQSPQFKSYPISNCVLDHLKSFSMPITNLIISVSVLKVTSDNL